jgi:serine/threonine protein kinase
VLLQEYCDAGTLSKQSSMWLPAMEDEKQMIKRLLLLQDVVKGLRYLHSKCIVHGDMVSCV